MYTACRNQDPLGGKSSLESSDQKLGKESVTQILHMEHFVKLSQEKYILKYNMPTLLLFYHLQKCGKDVQNSCHI